MKDKKEFYSLLAELDGQPYSEYEQLVGDFDFNRYVIKCTRIDLDPAPADGAQSPHRLTRSR